MTRPPQPTPAELAMLEALQEDPQLTKHALQTWRDAQRGNEKTVDPTSLDLARMMLLSSQIVPES
jgi:hypothetical protein